MMAYTYLLEISQDVDLDYEGIAMGFLNGDCTDDCACECANVFISSDGYAYSEAPVGGTKSTYNGSTQPHPTITFNVNLDEPASDAEYLMFAGSGDLAFVETYFELPSEPGWYTFSFMADAAALDSGRYTWDITYGYYKEDGGNDVLATEEDAHEFRALQDVINRDESAFGAGWTLPELDYLATNQHLGEMGLDVDGVQLITGNNHSVWFSKIAIDEENSLALYDHEDGNPYSFASIESLTTGDEISGYTITYTLTNPDGSQSIFEDYEDDPDPIGDIALLRFRKDRFGNDVRTYDYDENGLLTDITDAFGNVTHFAYDGGMVVSVTDFYGTGGAQTTTRGYDGYFLETVTQPDPDGGEGPLGNPITTYTYYDSGPGVNLLETVTDPRGLVTTVAYDHMRHVSDVTERCGGHITIESVASKTSPNMDPTGSDPAHLASLHATTAENSYEITIPELQNVFGTEKSILRNINHAITSIDVDGVLTTYEYEENTNLGLVSFGLLHEIKQPNLGRATEITSDIDGLADAITFTQEFNANSQRTNLKAAIGAADDFESSYTFNALGRMAQIVQQEQVGGNAVAHKTVDFAYNLAGQFTSIKRYVDVTDFVAESSYSYDEVGRLNALKHNRDASTFADYGFIWNDANRLTEFSNSVHSIENATYDYDDAGQLTAADRAGVTKDESYVYDSNGNRVDAVVPALGTNLDVVGIWQFNEGSGTSVADDSGHSNTASLNGSASWSEDDTPWAGKGEYSVLLNTGSATSGSVSVAGVEGEFTISLFFKGENVDTAYHQVLFRQGGIELSLIAGELEATFKNTSGESVYVCTNSSGMSDNTWYHAMFRYDGSTVTVSAYNLSFSASDSDNFSYCNKTPSSGSAVLGRDQFGMRSFHGKIADVTIFNTAGEDADIGAIRAGTFEYLPTTDYSTTEHNRIESDERYTYVYDAEGNLATRHNISDDSYRVYVWDYRNRLIEVSDYDSGDTLLKSVAYTYDVFNRRIAKHIDLDGDDAINRDEFYVYDGSDIVMDFVDGDGEVEGDSTELATRYLWGPGSDQLLAQESYDAGEDLSTQTLWALSDHQGSLRDYVQFTPGDECQQTEDGTSVVFHYTLDSFGSIVDGYASTRYIYTGQEFDTETGLYYYDARYYDATIGRFISEDPIGFAGDSSNVYRYVHNEPTKYVDPSGLAKVIYEVYEMSQDHGHDINTVIGYIAVTTEILHNPDRVKITFQWLGLYDADENTYGFGDGFPGPNDQAVLVWPSGDSMMWSGEIDDEGNRKGAYSQQYCEVIERFNGEEASGRFCFSRGSTREDGQRQINNPALGFQSLLDSSAFVVEYDVWVLPNGTVDMNFVEVTPGKKAGEVLWQKGSKRMKEVFSSGIIRK